MQKLVVLACLSVLIVVSAQGCTQRAHEDTPDAFVPVVIPDAGGGMDAPSTDASGRDGAAGDAPLDAFRAGDGGGCVATDLHSNVGASVAMGSTATSTDRNTPPTDCTDGVGAPDAWFTWTAPTGGAWVFDTIGSDFDTVLDVHMGCMGASLQCNDDGPLDSTSSVRATLGSGQTISIVVDGYDGESGNFVLGIHPYAAEICTDLIDNDSDGLVDCADFDDCDTLPACMETGAQCSDGIDNDGDFDIDCEDFDCDGEPACIETDCDDGIDNDDDFETDCEDFDCSTFPACDESMHCDDGIDNDADFDTDCADTDCASTPSCDESTHCTDHVDNDDDDDVDCADSECATNAACATPEANCNDGVDDDLDGAIDCGDSDCAAHCTESTLALCMNTTDDDGDALIDCGDLQCSCSTACPPAVAPPTTCPDMNIGSAVGDGVFHGVIAPYACGARADASCVSGGGAGGEIEIMWKAPADGFYEFTTNDTSHAGGTFDTVVSLRTDCSATADELDCNDDGGTGYLSSVFADLAMNDTVIIVIDALNVWDGGNVTLNVHAF